MFIPLTFSREISNAYCEYQERHSNKVDRKYDNFVQLNISFMKKIVSKKVRFTWLLKSKEEKEILESVIDVFLLER